jgi:pyruvate kinase
LVVKRHAGTRLKTEVLVGGVLKERKGVNIPGARLHFSGLTQKDRDDIEFGIENRVDYIAQSFVRTRDDIAKIRELVRERLPKCGVIAKIENREGIRNIDSIIIESDGIMIARGDMGISVPIYEVPIIQKEIIKKCNEKGKFVITATQMLESMVEHLRPTRAEVTDIANAILDGSDFVMLSAETAVGAHPVEAVRMMHEIIKFTEGSEYYRKRDAAHILRKANPQNRDCRCISR